MNMAASTQKIKPSKEQIAILTSKKDTMVISNPGTGKTTTLAYKVLDLLNSGVDPNEILCITFTPRWLYYTYEQWIDD